MTSAEHAELLRQQDADRAGERWEMTGEEQEAMADFYYQEACECPPSCGKLGENG